MSARGVSRRAFLRGAAGAGALTAAGVVLPRPVLGRAFRAVAPQEGTGRTVEYRWHSFFNTPFPKDIWQQRARVGYGKVRRYSYPVTHEWAEVAGPDLVPNMPISNWVYAPGRLAITGRELPEITIDTIGGVNSPAPDGEKTGFLPYDLMGQLGTAPTGGTARLKGAMESISRKRAAALRYPSMFGYHGWESEMKATITMDGAGLRKVLGLATDDPGAVLSWWSANKAAAEQAWWWWTFDEGGDVHVGGAGRKDVRTAFDTPLQAWKCTLGLTYEEATQRFVLTWDWVCMAGEMLISRWLAEALGTGFESNSLSDVIFDIRIGPDGTDLDVETGEDYTLYKSQGRPAWTWEAYSGDVPSLAVEYLNESTYGSPAAAYAGKEYAGSPYTYTPAAWNLRNGETLVFDWSEIKRKGGLTMKPGYLEPEPTEFPGQITLGGSRLTFDGPIDFSAWSAANNAGDWANLADAEHPDGLLPWGEPYLEWKVQPTTAKPSLFVDAPAIKPVANQDPDRTVPPFPQPDLGETPLLPPTGRRLKVDLYALLKPHLNIERWKQYDANDYMRLVSTKFPKMYRATPYFPKEPLKVEPYSRLASGLRMRVEGRELSEVTIDTVGGGPNPAGFLPADLMGGYEGGVSGGIAQIHSHLGYGTRARESRYRMTYYWGYYGWENFWDAEITLDRAAAKKVLGITDADFDAFGAWFDANGEALRQAWRQWFYSEFRKAEAMPWFNFPLQIWGFLLDLHSASGSQIVLKMSVLNETLDVTIGRWFIQTFLPHFEGSWEDLYFDITIGPDGSDVDLDATIDWGLTAYGGAKNRKWWWEPFLGDNPYLANEYRATNSTAAPYIGTDLSETPSNWNLLAGEQLNVHYGQTGLELVEYGPTASDFPAQIIEGDGVVSFTGPLDVAAWSQAEFPAEWADLGGLAPFGAPFIGVK